MTTRVYRFVSSDFAHTPGLIEYLRHGFSREEIISKAKEFWPGAEDKAYEHLADGNYHIEDDTAFVYVADHREEVDVAVAIT